MLRDDGTCWLNLGDSYSSGMRTDDIKERPSYRHDRNQSLPSAWDQTFLPRTSWQPQQKAFALQGLVGLRSCVAQAKPDVGERTLTGPQRLRGVRLSKSGTYYYDKRQFGEAQSPAPGAKNRKATYSESRNKQGGSARATDDFLKRICKSSCPMAATRATSGR